MNKKGNISVTLLTAMVFIFSTILIVSTLYSNMAKKQYTIRNEYIEVEGIKNTLLIVGSDICFKLNDNRINFDEDTIKIEIKNTFNNEVIIVSYNNSTITLTIKTVKDISYTRSITLDNSIYTLSNTVRI